MKGEFGAERQQNNSCHSELSKRVELELSTCSFQAGDPGFSNRRTKLMQEA